ncbi:MAG: hypothetical protein ACYTF8_03045 [Planctomycetota bacterium]
MSWRLAWLVLCLAACGKEGAVRLTVGGAGAAGGEGLVLGLRSDDTVRFARRIDGGIAEHRHAPVTEARDQFLLITTKEPGVDQCKILVLDDRGRLAADYRISGASPFPVHPRRARYEGENTRLLLAPIPSAVIPFAMGRHRLIALCARNSYAPSPFVLLEAPSRDRLVERLVFWNFGHLHFLLEDVPYVVILGMSNRLRTQEAGYPLFVAVFDLREIAWDDPGAPCLRGTSPRADEPKTDATHLFRRYLCVSSDPRGTVNFVGRGWVSARIRDGVLHATVNSGMVYELDLASSKFDLRPGPDYREDFPRRRARDAGLPALEEHVADLKAATLVWTRE